MEGRDAEYKSGIAKMLLQCSSHAGEVGDRLCCSDIVVRRFAVSESGRCSAMEIIINGRTGYKVFLFKSSRVEATLRKGEVSSADDSDSIIGPPSRDLHRQAFL